MRKVIESVQPFNHFTLRDCFFSALFPALDALGGDSRATAILASSYVEYSYENSRFVQENKNVPQETLEKLMAEQNIRMQVNFEYQEDIVDFVRKSIDENKLLMVTLVDSISYDPQTNKKTDSTAGFRHWILFYGYDDETEEFYVIDHFFLASPIYCKLRMKYEELVRSYKLVTEKFFSKIQELTAIKDVEKPSDLYTKYLDVWMASRKVWNSDGNPILQYMENIIDVLSRKEKDYIANNILSLIEDYSRISVYYVKEKYVIELIDKNSSLIKSMDCQTKDINSLKKIFFGISKNNGDMDEQTVSSLIEITQKIYDEAVVIENKIEARDWQ